MELIVLLTNNLEDSGRGLFIYLLFPIEIKLSVVYEIKHYIFVM